MATPTAIVGYLALFTAAGVSFLFINLVVGRLVRPSDPHQEKLEIYECGEPTIGSSFVQFDLRFYVVALLFIIFDVEVAFFFPWAVVFGKSTQLMQLPEENPQATAAAIYRELGYRELGVTDPRMPSPVAGTSGVQGQSQRVQVAIEQNARRLAMLTMVDIAVFFGVLMVGFAYVWRRGDLDWVRAVSPQRGLRRQPDDTGAPHETPVLSA